MTVSDNKNIDIYSVTRLNREVKAVLEGSFPTLWVKGEISNLAQPASGHMYFSLKDPNSQVRCAMFRGRNRLLKFAPENGTEVLLQVSVGLYEGRGEFQLIVEHMELAGEGALQRAFEELKQKLFKEGLFSEEHKKSLPEYPQNIGIITSATGAAIRDILSVLNRRFPLTGIIIYPVPVQGENAAAEILKMLNKTIQRNEVDVIIVARGGGSIEDLWAFNDEALARAIHACPIPFVSGIGHEIDFTIVDFVADVRAATPSAAAELVCPDNFVLKQSLQQTESRLEKLIVDQLYELTMKLEYFREKVFSRTEKLTNLQLRLNNLHSRIENETRLTIYKQVSQLKQMTVSLTHYNPLNMLQSRKQLINTLSKQLITIHQQKQLQLKETLLFLSRSLEMVNPLSILARGYSIVKDTEGTVIQKAQQLAMGDMVEIIFSHGRANAEIRNTKEKSTNKK